MYTMDELNDKLLSELKNITEELGIKGASKLSKQDLIYKILDEQAISKPKKSSSKSHLQIQTFNKGKSSGPSKRPAGRQVQDQVKEHMIDLELQKTQNMKNK